MKDVISSLKAGEPFSHSAVLNVMEWRDKRKNNYAAKYLATEIAFAGITITSTLEGIAAIVAGLVVKGLSYVARDKDAFQAKVVQPVLKYRKYTRLAFSYSIAALFYNVTTKDKLKSKTIIEVDKFNIKLEKMY